MTPRLRNAVWCCLYVALMWTSAGILWGFPGVLFAVGLTGFLTHLGEWLVRWGRGEK